MKKKRDKRWHEITLKSTEWEEAKARVHKDGNMSLSMLLDTIKFIWHKIMQHEHEK